MKIYYRVVQVSEDEWNVEYRYWYSPLWWYQNCHGTFKSAKRCADYLTNNPFPKVVYNA